MADAEDLKSSSERSAGSSPASGTMQTCGFHRVGENVNLPAWLQSLDACKEAVQWSSDYPDLQSAWDACERADWMLWLLRQKDGSITPRTRLAMCACARTALQYIPAGEDRPRLAIETAEKYACGEASEDELHAAAAAAADAAAAAVSHANYAAASAAAAAVSTSVAAYATYAAAAYALDAAAAAHAAAAAAAFALAAAAAARTRALRKMADLVRGVVPTVSDFVSGTTEVR